MCYVQMDNNKNPAQLYLSNTTWRHVGTLYGAGLRLFGQSSIHIPPWSKF